MANKPWEVTGIDRPDFESMLDESGGLRDQYNIRSSYDDTYEKYLANYAASQETSPWLQAQNQVNKYQNQIDRELETRNRLSQKQQAQDAMSMGKGLRSGSGEMLGNQTMSSKMQGGQTVQDKYNQSRLGSLQKEQEDKRKTLQGLAQFAPGVARYESTIDKGNVSSILGERERAYAFEKAKQDEYMGAWSGGQLADQMEKRAEQYRQS